MNAPSRPPIVVARRSVLTGAATLSVIAVAGCSSESPGELPLGGDDNAREAPMLAERVESGELPPLEQRLPKNPVVLQTVTGPGRYGGTLRYASPTDTVTPLTIHAHAGFLEFDLAGKEHLPSVAESFEVNDTSTTYTIKIREGLRWSDGEPYTKDDVEFTMTSFFGNETLVPAAPYYFSDADQAFPTVDWLDDLTFTITFGTSNPLFPTYMAHTSIGYQFMKPKHYLEQFHADFVGAQEAAASAKKAGFDSWDLYFNDRANPWTNPDLPVMGAFTVTASAGGSGTATLERNPYYFKTDLDGRQLPYLDGISVQVLGQEALDLRAANGEFDLQGTGLAFGGAQVLLENAEAKDYRVGRWMNSGGTAALCPNLSHQDPQLRVIFSDVRFRAAVSHAINRENINNALMNGVGIIRHPLATDGTDYAVENGGETFLGHDPDRANALLDELGMTKKGQWRTRPDGKPFEPVLVFVESSAQVPLANAFQMVIQDLATVGIKMVLKPVDGTLYGELRMGNDFDIDGTSAPSDHMDLEAVWWVPTAGNSHTAPGYGMYYSTNGESGMKPSGEMQQLIDHWDALRTANTDEERIAAGQAIMQQHNDKVYMIGLVRPPFQPVAITNRTKNVLVDDAQFSFATGREGITKTEQVWVE